MKVHETEWWDLLTQMLAGPTPGASVPVVLGCGSKHFLGTWSQQHFVREKHYIPIHVSKIDPTSKKKKKRQNKTHFFGHTT